MICENLLVSIVMPVFNVEKYINASLLSCLNQTYKNIEILVVDDCSRDNSLKVAETLSEIDNRIKIYKNIKNHGTYHARRIGTMFSKGDYIIYLDPDDELSRNAVEILIFEASTKNPDIIFFGVQNISDDGRCLKITHNKLPVDKKNRRIDENIFKCKKLNLGTPGKAYKRNIILKAFNFLNVNNEVRLVYGEDVLIFFSVIVNSISFSCVYEGLYGYRYNLQSITKLVSKEMIEFKCAQLQEINTLIKNLDSKDYDNINPLVYNNSARNIERRLMATYYTLQLELALNFDYMSRCKTLSRVFMYRRTSTSFIRLLIHLVSLGAVKF